MKALQYRFNMPRYLAVKAAGNRFGALTYGRLSALSLVDAPEPSPPGPEWLSLAPILTGICGTDTALIGAKASPLLEPFASFPAILGHEIVACVRRVGETEFDVGQRVVVDPFLHCVVRGLEPCANCSEGKTSACRNMTRGRLAPAMILGTCRDLPGGWSEVIAAHPTQVFPVPHGMADETAVLVEPLSVALHAVLAAMPPPGTQVLIIGAGTIGLCTLAALRLLGCDCHITIAARHAFQGDLAQRLGADAVQYGGRDALLELAEQSAGATLHKPTLGRRVPDWGFGWVADCVGTPTSLDDGLRVTRPGGTFVLLGCAGEIPRLDWTLVWARELRVQGSCGYGGERFQGRRLHTFELALELLEAKPDYPLSALVTHRFSLDEHEDALRAAFGRKASGAVKVVFAL